MKRILRIAGTIALMVVFLVLFLRKSDPARVVELISTIDAGWLALAIGCNLLALFCRGYRWRWILEPDREFPWYPAFFATAVGYMLSMLLPVRAADVTRPALLARKTQVRFSTALGTVLTERILDLVAMMSCFLAFILLHGLAMTQAPEMAAQRLFLRSAGIVSASIVLAVATFLVSMLIFGQNIRRVHEILGRILPARLRPSWMRFFDSFATSLELIHHRRALLHVVVLTAGVWISLASQFYFVMRAFDWDLPFISSFFVTGMAILGLIVPTPAGVGGHHKATQIALTSFFGFDVDGSVAVAVIFHLVSVVPVMVVGALLVFREGLRWSVVSHIGEETEPGAGEKPD